MYNVENRLKNIIPTNRSPMTKFRYTDVVCLELMNLSNINFKYYKIAKIKITVLGSKNLFSNDLCSDTL